MARFTLLDYLKSQAIPSGMIEELASFRKVHKEIDDRNSIPCPHPRYQVPKTLYQGPEVLRKCLAILLAGKHLLLVGDKGSGKNILAETLAFLMLRPIFEAPGHIYADESSLFGDRTLEDGNVKFEIGPVTEAMENGGFAVLDEINMMRPEAVAVLHGVTDTRRRVEVKGYQRVDAHPAFRCIATMNVGYAGTQELNEALVDRFVVVKVSGFDQPSLANFLVTKHEGLDPEVALHVAGIFTDVMAKFKKSEVTSRCVTIRGVLDAIDLIKMGLSPREAFYSTVSDKSFDDFENVAIRDLINTRISDLWTKETFFPVKVDKPDKPVESITVDMSATVKNGRKVVV